MRKTVLWCFFTILLLLFIWTHYRCYLQSNEQFEDDKKESNTTWFKQNVSGAWNRFNYDYLTYFPRFLGNWTYSSCVCPSRRDPSLEGRGLNYDGYGRAKK